MTDPAPDSLTKDELLSQAQEKVTDVRDSKEAEITALGIEEEGAEEEATVEEAGDDVEEATDGAVSSEDYQGATSPPSFPSSTGLDSVFARTLEIAVNELLNEAISNLNAFTRQALEYALELMDDVDALLAEIQAEAAKVGIAHAAGLLVPPNRGEVEELRSATQQVQDESQAAVVELRSAPSRRTAARLLLEEDDRVPASVDPELQGVDNRLLEVQPIGAAAENGAPLPVNLSLAGASPGAPSLQQQADTRGLVSDSLPVATTELQAQVIDKVSYIALCLLIKGIGTSADKRKRVDKILAKVQEIIDNVVASLGGDFVNELQKQIQERAADFIEGVTETVQDKLDAFDTFLSTGFPELPTFVGTVSAFGDEPADLPVLESIAAQCDLIISSFCQFQGLLEISKTLDAQLGIVLPRPPAIGRVRLIIQAESEDLPRELSTQPDTEANMFLVGSREESGLITAVSDSVGPDATHVIARFPRANIRPEISAPVPPIFGVLAEDASFGDQSLLISGLPTNIATLGNVIINLGPLQQTLRYSSFEDDGGDIRFTLIDAVEGSGAGAGGDVQVTGEQRDTFEGAFTQNRAIKGGEGRLALAGDGEQRQQLNYLSSTFDETTGHYTFEIDTATTPLATGVPEHKFLLLCRPHQTEKEILYKDKGLGAVLTLGQRFRVVGNVIFARDPKDPFPNDGDFDFFAPQPDTLIVDDAGDYDSDVNDVYRLCIGSDTTPVEIDSVATAAFSPPNSRLILKKPFHGGDQDRVTLCRVIPPTARGSSTLRMKLDRRQKDDIGVADLDPGESRSISGRVIIDGGGATVTVSSNTTKVIEPSTGTVPTQQIFSAAPIIRGDEEFMRSNGALLDVQSVRTTFTTAVKSVDVANQSLTYELPGFPDPVSVIGNQIYLASGTTKFASFFKVGDFVFARDTLGTAAGAAAKILEINDDPSVGNPPVGGPPYMVVNDSWDTQPASECFLCAPVGDSMSRVFTIHREPRETLDFTAIARVNEPDTPFFILILSDPTEFSHQLQEPEVPTTVKIIPQQDYDNFRLSFSDPDQSVTPRFDGTIVPPGTTAIRAAFENPEFHDITGDPVGLLVEQSSKIFPVDSQFELAVSPPNARDADNIYTFNLVDPLVFPLADGDVIEVETTDVFGQILDLFGDPIWAGPLQDALDEILRLLGIMESKVCRLLAGRPMDVSITAAAIVGATTTARLNLFPIRLIIQTLILGLPKSVVIPRVRLKLQESGMDAAVAAVDEGDPVAIGQLTPETATSEGQALAALDAFRDTIQNISDLTILDNMKAALRGRESDKELLADVRRTFTEQAGDKLERETTAADNLEADMETLSS